MRNLDRFYNRLNKRLMSNSGTNMLFRDVVKDYINSYQKDVASTQAGKLNVTPKSKKFILNPYSNQDEEYIVAEICDIFETTSVDGEKTYAVRLNILCDYLNSYKNGDSIVIGKDHGLCGFKVIGFA